MKSRPKGKDEGLFAHGYGVRLVLQGIMFGILAILAFRMGEAQMGTLAGAQTMTLYVLAFSQVIQAFNMRSSKSLFKTGFFTNRQLNLAVLFSTVMMLLVLFTPGVMNVFGLVYLTPQLYLEGLGLILVPLVVMEFSKAVGLIKHAH